jgi:hypothetical protein
MTVETTERPAARGRARATTHSDELLVGQRNDLHIEGSDYVERGTLIEPVETALPNGYVAQLAFNEEPVKIMINAQGENPENAVFVQVNGKGAEILMNGAFVSMGFIPCDIEVTTKRKYLEVLARAKKESIQTDFGQNQNNGESFNVLKRRNALQHNFTVVEDANPIGRAWLQSIIADKA